MSYINESVSSLADLITKLDAFLTGTPGWTQDVLDTGNGKWAVHKTGAGFECRIAAKWDTATPSNVGLYQYLGAYNVGAEPYAQADDSGNGAQSGTNATLAGARYVAITNTPVQYWCFEDDNYFHVVVETSAGNFKHFGCGQLAKFGDWTGGEYVYGQHIAATGTTLVGVAVNNTAILDGLASDGGTPAVNNMEEFVATLHVESLPNQVASGKYAVFMGNQGSGNLGNDRQAAPKARGHFFGGFRAGPYARPLSRFMAATDLSGHMPLYPIVGFYWDRSTGDVYGPMGYMKDVRGCSLRNLVGGDELTIGGDTWIVFPTRARWTGSGAHTSTSDYQGIAYKKVTT